MAFGGDHDFYLIKNDQIVARENLENQAAFRATRLASMRPRSAPAGLPRSWPRKPTAKGFIRNHRQILIVVSGNNEDDRPAGRKAKVTPRPTHSKLAVTRAILAGGLARTLVLGPTLARDPVQAP